MASWNLIITIMIIVVWRQRAMIWTTILGMRWWHINKNRIIRICMWESQILYYNHIPQGQMQYISWHHLKSTMKYSSHFSERPCIPNWLILLLYSNNGSSVVSIILPNIHIDGLVQDCSNSSALAMELLQSCTRPSISCYSHYSCTHSAHDGQKEAGNLLTLLSLIGVFSGSTKSTNGPSLSVIILLQLDAVLQRAICVHRSLPSSPWGPSRVIKHTYLCWKDWLIHFKGNKQWLWFWGILGLSRIRSN